DLGLPTKITHEVVSGIDKKHLTIFFRGIGAVKLKNIEMWDHYMKGKEPQIGDRADVEYWTNRRDNSPGEKQIVAMRIY
ncbi:hypothetical protein ABTF08_19820, partial [Acinetobacter baumannii]